MVEEGEEGSLGQGMRDMRNGYATFPLRETGEVERRGGEIYGGGKVLLTCKARVAMPMRGISQEKVTFFSPNDVFSIWDEFALPALVST